MNCFKILLIDHSFHQITKSSDFFYDYLRLIGEVTLIYDHSWKGRSYAKDYSGIAKEYDLVIIWQLPSVVRRLASIRKHGIIFVPMYDAAVSLKDKFWKQIRHVKVVCFSSAMAAICSNYGMNIYLIQYYPEESKPSLRDYTTKRLFFWQRHHRPGWREVSEHLPLHQFEKSHFHHALDPHIEADSFPTESEKKDHSITTSQWFEEKQDFIEVLTRCNVFFCSRNLEGIGFSFLDAMVNGLIPVGYD